VTKYLGVATDELNVRTVSTTSVSAATGTITNLVSTSALVGGQPIVPNISAVTTNTTAIGTTLTAAQLAGAEQVNLLRSGATANYTDTTDNAVNIIAAIKAATGVAVPVGFTYLLGVTNTVAFVETLAGGTGVTISGTATLAASTTRQFSVKVTAATTITMTSLGSGAL
jgi:hypothetical protein